MSFFVYILASKRNGTIYVGSTDSLASRVHQHRTERFSGFTSRYNVKTLVWYHRFETRDAAFKRERQLKKWNRIWKIELIEKMNPGWRDLMSDFDPPPGPLSEFNR